MFKLSGVFLIIFAGFLTAFNIKRNYRLRIEFIEDFIKSLEMMHTQIAFYKTPVYELISMLEDYSSGKVKEFYKNVLLDFNEYGIEKAYEININKIESGLEKRDKGIICDFAKTLGNSDYETELKYINGLKSEFEAQLKMAKENKTKNEKAKCTLVISSFIVLALLLAG